MADLTNVDIFTGLIPDSDEVRADFDAVALPMAWDYREIFARLDQIVSSENDPSSWLRIENQGRVGSCQGNALTTGAEMVHYFETGKVVQLSRLFAYIGSQMQSGGARGDNGSSMISGIRLLQKIGVPSELLVPYTDNYQTMVRRYQQVARKPTVVESARSHIVETHTVCESFQQAMAWTATKSGSVHLGMNWPINLNSYGVCTRYRGNAGRGGHAIEGVYPARINSEWVLKIANSHGSNYAKRGYFFMNEQSFSEVLQENRFGVYLIGAPGSAEEPKFTGQFNPLMGA